MDIILKHGEGTVELDPVFKHATNGLDAGFRTRVTLGADERFLKVNFMCEDNLFTEQNSMKVHNAPLYNQEVFEVFIGVGEEDPTAYFEVEINPNNAVWIGEIANPELGNGPQRIVRQLEPEAAGIAHGTEVKEGAWGGFLHIPWELAGEPAGGDYRVNFYRIRSRVSHADPDWECDAETCDFVCWRSTLSGAEPAFHRPRRFGHLKVQR
ncbi:carbohydrate-binding family 9-like protein [Leadbetterella sp. DM7]|uniref:carbohydrate-binding family 9-like protein n=1 Tax=Leadbetterella sp. DM7 TaxID=3235085 RepID=UPI00349E83ED